MNTDRIHDLNAGAEAQGLSRGMAFSEARAFCPALVSRPADPAGDARFLAGLARWAGRYCPWVGLDGSDALLLDITGSAHLFGGEAGLVADIRTRLTRAGMEADLGLADSRGAAWALSHHGGGIAEVGGSAAALAALPVAALRLEAEVVTALRRLGLYSIGALAGAARAPLARRFGPGLLARLDQAMGDQPEPITPLAEPPHYAVRLTLPEPIGLTADVMAGLERLLHGLCDKLQAREAGARALCLTLRRVDQHSQHLPLRLAVAMSDPARILPLFARAVEAAEAGFGIDQLRLAATLVEPMPLRPASLRAMPLRAALPRPALPAGRAGAVQGGSAPSGSVRGDAEEAAAELLSEQMQNLITRIGTRIGLDNILRFQPVASHIPERGFRLVPAEAGGARDPSQAVSRPYRLSGGDLPSGELSSGALSSGASRPRSNSSREGLSCHNGPRDTWPVTRPRPLHLFPPEPIAAHGFRPPARFRWRRMRLTTGRATGPERIAPEWWVEDAAWQAGLRDYWRVETLQGWRLWLFHTPQRPGWYVQGEFA